MNKTMKLIEKSLGHVLLHYVSSVRRDVKRNKDGSLDLRTQPAKTLWGIISSVDEHTKMVLLEELEGVYDNEEGT